MPPTDMQKTECDAGTVKAIITHRYYVLAQYTRSVGDACRQEISRLKRHAATPSGDCIDALSARSLLRWLRLYTWDWRARRPITLDTLVRKHKLLHTVYSMRRELSELWSQSSASTDQLLKQLCDWRERAESSGIAALREFARRLPHLVIAYPAIGSPITRNARRILLNRFPYGVVYRRVLGRDRSDSRGSPAPAPWVLARANVVKNVENSAGFSVFRRVRAGRKQH